MGSDDLATGLIVVQQPCFGRDGRRGDRCAERLRQRQRREGAQQQNNRNQYAQHAKQNCNYSSAPHGSFLNGQALVIKRFLCSSSSALSNRVFVVIAAMLLSAPLWAASPLEVTDAWVRATVPGQPVAGAYLTIRSASAAKLVGVRSLVARSAEIHSMTDEGGVMRMRKLDALALPAGEPVELKSGGNHIMLLEIKRQLNAGETVPLTLM